MPASWAELTEHHRALYRDATIGGGDPAAGFDRYLADPRRVATWVAGDRGEIVGMAGLLAERRSAEVEPVIVAAASRSRGIGGALVRCALEEARRPRAVYVRVRPVARNAEALAAFTRSAFARSATWSSSSSSRTGASNGGPACASTTATTVSSGHVPGTGPRTGPGRPVV